MNWYLQALKSYANFSGRARRKEYWYFVLFNFIFSFALGFIDGMIGSYSYVAGIGILGGIYTIAIIIPSFPFLFDESTILDAVVGGSCLY